ncbi:APRR-like protein [Ostreococcus tauri]|uniref:APRR-like protein n=1 Tax=Ostreococcus tauri TaxID=70448 RepID=A0A1Y5I9U6_OSTTA|nr:APRR-like protein [Ostreococcus tauri]
MATNGKEVLEVLRGRPKGVAAAAEDVSVDMILLDVLMPALDGEVELVEVCKSNEALRGVPIVIMSTVDERKACGTRYEHSGAAGFLTKPVNRTELKESLSHTRMLKSHESGSAENDGSGNDPNVGSAKSSLTKLTNGEKAAGGSGDGGSGGAIMFDCITKVTRNRDVARLRRWIDGPVERAVPETAALEDPVKAPEAVAVRTRARFRGLSVQLIKAHGGATTMLELSLPEHSSEHVVVRRSNSRSAFKGFQTYLKSEKKESSVQMMSLDLTQQQHQSFYEASSMMPPADFARFYGPIMPAGMPPPPMDLPLPPPPYIDMNQFTAAAFTSASIRPDMMDSTANPFWSVLQTAADHTQQTSSSQAAEHRAAAIRRFLKKRKERNFDKKVRYASRQQLAASRPRLRGQFVRNAEETTTENGSNGSDGKKSNEFNASAAKGEVQGREEQYVDRHGSNTGTSNEGSKEGSRSSSRDGSK